MKSKDSEERVIQVNENLKVGVNIKRLRLEHGYKQTEFVVKLQLAGVDISIYSYNRIEQGTQNPTTNFLLACCKLLNCDMNTIFDYK